MFTDELRKAADAETVAVAALDLAKRDLRAARKRASAARRDYRDHMVAAADCAGFARDDSPVEQPTEPITVYWRECSTGVVNASYLGLVRDGRVHFTDGGWNPIKVCYLTLEHAVRHACDCPECRYRAEGEMDDRQTGGQRGDD